MTVLKQQCLLHVLGYYSGQLDGLWGNASRAACVGFQKAFGLTPDGYCGEETEKALRHAVCYGPEKQVETHPPDQASGWETIRYFQRREFRCPCPRCGGYPVEPALALAQAADATRAEAGSPMVISSGVRCKAHNAEVGGVANSRHLLGHAMDFRIVGKTAQQSLDIVRRQKCIVYAYAIDNDYVHADIGG